MASKSVAVIGGSIWGNRGASAMLETTIHRLQEAAPDSQIFVFTPYPEKDRSLCIQADLTFYDSRPLAVIQYFLKALWAWFTGLFNVQNNLSGGAGALTRADLLLDIGGITFADGRLKFLPYNILTIWPSILHRVPVIKLSQAAGSFKNPIIKVASKIFLSRCDHFFARGEKTLTYLDELGLDENKTTMAADIAFGYQPGYCLSSENNTAVTQLCQVLEDKAAAGEKVIGISPSILVSEKMKASHSNYIDLVIEMIKQSNYQNQTFVVFPNAAREGSKKSKNNDLLVVREARDRAELELPGRIYKKILWVNYDLNSAGVEAVIQHTNLVLSSRFHAMVASLRLAKPTLVIGWGHKYQEVMQRFGQENFVYDYRMASNSLAEQIKNLLESEAEVTRQINSALEVEKALSMRQFDYVAEKLS
jgi:polysaccharide pyruvyl transferase WcaK-like protein